MNVVRLNIYIWLIAALILGPVETNFLGRLKDIFSVAKQHNASVDYGDVDYEHINIIIKRVKRQDGNICIDDDLMYYLAQLQVVNPESIVNLATQDDLPVVCKAVSHTLEVIETYLQSCTVPNDRNLYILLIKGIARFVDVLCEKETKTRTAFLQHADCLRQLKTDFETCYGPADWTEDIKKKDLCCAYKQVVDCYFVKAELVCGRAAAKAMRKIVTSVIDAVIPVHCTLLLQPCVVHDQSVPMKANMVLVITPTILNLILQSYQQILTLFYTIIPSS